MFLVNSPFFGFLWETAKIVIISLAIILPVRYFIAQPFFVRGASMEPAYSSGDYLIINEIGYRFTDPQRGDVIVFRFPDNPSQYYIKRIIGLPGETVSIKNSEILINGKAYPSPPTPGNITIKLDDSEYFVLGDNRNASFDSRRWGALPADFIVGKIFLRAWPFDKFELAPL